MIRRLFLAASLVLGLVAPSAAQQSGPVPGYTTIQDEGTALTRRRLLNFIGSGIACVDTSSTASTDCTITNTGVTSLTGTANQVIVSAATGAVTLSLPQSIATASTPTFGGLTLNGTLAMGANAITSTGTIAANTTTITSGASNALVLVANEGSPAFVDFRRTGAPSTSIWQWYLKNSSYDLTFYDGGDRIILGRSGGGTATTFALAGVANVTPIGVTGYSLTGSSALSLVSLAGTINTSGSPDVVKIAITDTARGASTTFFNIYGGSAGTTSLLSVSNSGAMTQAGVAFASLGTPANGTIQFCTDCDPPTLVDSTCTSAGTKTGALAYRVNGAWKCIS